MTHTEREPQYHDSIAPQMDAYRDGTAVALTGCVGVYGTDWTDPAPIADAELEARADDLYTTIMAALDSLPAATWTPEYREAKRQVQAMEIEFRAVCLELSTRLHARSVAWNELPDLTGGQR